MTTLIGGIIFVVVCLVVGLAVAAWAGLSDDLWWWFRR